MTATWTHSKEENCEGFREGMCEHLVHVPRGGDVEVNTESPSVKTKKGISE